MTEIRVPAQREAANAPDLEILRFAPNLARQNSELVTGPEEAVGGDDQSRSVPPPRGSNRRVSSAMRIKWSAQEAARPVWYLGRGFLIYGFSGAGFEPAADAELAVALCSSEESALSASSGDMGEGTAAGAGVARGFASLRGTETRDADGFDDDSGDIFFAVRGSVVKTWPQREHLKVGLSAGRTRSSIRYRV